MSTAQLRVRSFVRFAALTIVLGAGYFLAHAVPALLVAAVL